MAPDAVTCPIFTRSPARLSGACSGAGAASGFGSHPEAIARSRRETRPATTLLYPPMVGSVEPHVFEVRRLIVDAADGWGDPVGELARLDHRRAHQRGDVGAVLVGRQPLVRIGLPVLGAHHRAVGGDVDLVEGADAAVEGAVWQLQLEGDAGIGDHLVP